MENKLKENAHESNIDIYFLLIKNLYIKNDCIWLRGLLKVTQRYESIQELCYERKKKRL